MLPKPKHLEIKYAEQFQDESVVAAYHFRPPYPAELFPMLTDLSKGEPKTVLDAGCGLGHIARPLAPLVERVDAVDFSAAMIREGQRMPGGDAANINWIYGPIETAPLRPPYQLITAGQSLHWFDWPVVMHRFAGTLAPGGYVAIIDRLFTDPPWQSELLALISRYSTNRDYQPTNLIEELVQRNLFHIQGERLTAPIRFQQSVAAYLESIHSSNGFSRDRMKSTQAEAFDEQVTELLATNGVSESFAIDIQARVTWGTPQKGEI